MSEEEGDGDPSFISRADVEAAKDKLRALPLPKLSYFLFPKELENLILVIPHVLCGICLVAACIVSEEKPRVVVELVAFVIFSALFFAFLLVTARRRYACQRNRVISALGKALECEVCNEVLPISPPRPFSHFSSWNTWKRWLENDRSAFDRLVSNIDEEEHEREASRPVKSVARRTIIRCVIIGIILTPLLPVLTIIFLHPTESETYILLEQVSYAFLIPVFLSYWLRIIPWFVHKYESLGSVTRVVFGEQDVLLAPPDRKPAMLDIQGASAPFHLQFDENHKNEVVFSDPDWEEALMFLKPVGLHGMLHGDKSDSFGMWKLYEGRSDWETSLYHLGKEIGFVDDVLESYRCLCTAGVVRDEVGMQFSVVKHERMGLQLFTEGDVALVLESCNEYFDGEEIRQLTDEMKKKVLDQAREWNDQRDISSLALAYRPVNPKYSSFVENVEAGLVLDGGKKYCVDSEDDNENEERKLWKVLQDQVFLGLVGLGRRPVSGAAQWVSQLHEAGIRFVLSSDRNTRKTRSFGRKLGLDTDWNACISLAVLGHECSSAALDDMKLPRGVESIRDHLENCDNVPLLVSLFCDATLVRTADVVRLYKEYDEVVCYVGDGASSGNVSAFCEADISVHTDLDVDSPLKSVKSPFGLLWGNALCDLFFEKKILFDSLFESFLNGRRFVANGKQAVFLWSCLCGMLFCLMLFGSFTGYPLIVFGVHIYWYVIVIFPLLVVGVVYAPAREEDLRLLMAQKGGPEPEYALHVVRVVSYFVYRFVPTSIWLCVLFLSGAGLENEVVDETCPKILEVQFVVCWFITYYSVFLSLGFAHRTNSIRLLSQCGYCSLFVGGISAIVLQSVFTSVELWIHDLSLSLSRFPPSIVTLSFLWPLFTIIVDESVKWWDRKWFEMDQKRRYLEFSTRLGLNSPIPL